MKQPDRKSQRHSSDPLGPARPPVAPAVYTINECAKRLGIKREKVEFLIEDGSLPALDLALRARHCYRVPIEAVDDFLKRRRPSA